MAEERKQISAIDVQDRLTVVKNKIAFLHDAIRPIKAGDSSLDMDQECAEGLGWILRDIEHELYDITQAEIVTGVE